MFQQNLNSRLHVSFLLRKKTEEESSIVKIRKNTVYFTEGNLSYMFTLFSLVS